jgi:hypothetical protein
MYETVATASMWALLMLLVVALVLARQARVQEAAEVAKQSEPLPAVGIPIRPGSVARRYDYHNLLGLHRIKFAVVSILLVVLLVFFFMISRGMTLFHKQFLPTTLLAHFVVSYFTYLHYKRSYIEINEMGIAYQGMVKSIYSPWNGVKKTTSREAPARLSRTSGIFRSG